MEADRVDASLYCSRFSEGAARDTRSPVATTKSVCYGASAMILIDQAIALHQRGNLDDAEAIYQKVLDADARNFDALHMLGIIHAQRGSFEKAEKFLRKALSVDSRVSQCFHNYGTILANLGRFEDAVISYNNAIKLTPSRAPIYSDLGIALHKLKRYEEAIAVYDKILSLEPNFAGVEGARLDAKMQLCEWRNYDTECSHLISSIRSGTGNTLPFHILGIPSTPDDQLRCAKQHVSNKFPLSEKSIWRRKRYNHKKIRVAYVLLDVRLITELFEQHDRSRFEIIGVSLDISGVGETRKRIVVAFDQFHDVHKMSDKEVARLLLDLEVDIAVDLKGYTADYRFGIFACRPAPIQVSYLGYPSTMGTPSIDYVIADKVVVPFEHEQFYTEKIVHLPDCYQVNDSKREAAENTPTRQAGGLPEHGIVFCCFNNNYKITPRVFDCWMRILKEVENSVLWLLEGNATAARNLRDEAVLKGINSDRLIFAKRVPLAEHLARHRLADLFLDTLPYTAHTTASDALWVGLPLLTCLGQTFAGRVSASVLKAIHLPELITTTLEAYEQIAIDLATHPEKLAAIKRKLAEKRLTTPLFDTKLFTENIEAAYIAMYERHKAGLAPDHIIISKS